MLQSRRRRATEKNLSPPEQRDCIEPLRSIMLSWLKRRAPKEGKTGPVNEPAAQQGYGMSQAYRSLHTYLVNRYSSLVVMTFAEVEDLLGSPLPAGARQDLEWWNADNDQNFEHSNSWRLANRTAVANLAAQKVTFTRG
jgi:hypothetical protein